MRLDQKAILITSSYSSRIIEEKARFFNSPLHHHTQIELVYVKKGYGVRTVGNTVEEFEAGEMVLLGPGLAHEWNASGMVAGGYDPPVAIVAYFDGGIFSQDFYGLAESNQLNSLFQKAERGIKVTGETRNIIAAKVDELLQKKEFDAILGLLEIFHILSISIDIECITDENYLTTTSGTSHRLSDVFNYVAAHYSRDITLDEIARLAHLTPPAFCRLFKQKMGRPFVSYLNEVRITHACRFLKNTEDNVSEIAFNCGYKTISNFNKFFKKSTGLPPKDYREKITRASRIQIEVRNSNDGQHY